MCRRRTLPERCLLHTLRTAKATAPVSTASSLHSKRTLSPSGTRSRCDSDLSCSFADGGTSSTADVVVSKKSAEPAPQPAAVDDAKAAEVAALARALEDQMGWPVDIECAYHGETLYLLQARRPPCDWDRERGHR